MTYLLLITLVSIATWGLFRHLIKQSKNPKGWIGRQMMRLWNRIYLPMVDWSLAPLMDKTPQNILDVGVGNGKSTQHLHEAFPQSNIYGIDISATAIAEAQKLNAPSISFSVRNIEETGFSPQQFDLICAYQTHFHWQNPTQAFSELHRILSDCGTLIIACETAKLNYYLPLWKDLQTLKAYLRPLGWILSDFRRNRTFTAFYLTKSAIGA